MWCKGISKEKGDNLFVCTLVFDLCWDKYYCWHTEALESFIRKLNALIIGSYLCPELGTLRDMSAREVLKNICRRSDRKQLQLVSHHQPKGLKGPWSPDYHREILVQHVSPSPSNVRLSGLLNQRWCLCFTVLPWPTCLSRPRMAAVTLLNRGVKCQPEWMSD